MNENSKLFFVEPEDEYISSRNIDDYDFKSVMKLEYKVMQLEYKLVESENEKKTIEINSIYANHKLNEEVSKLKSETFYLREEISKILLRVKILEDEIDKY